MADTGAYRLANNNVQQLVSLEAVFEAMPSLEFDETANFGAEAGHDQYTHSAGTDAEPIRKVDFDQTLGL